MDKKTLDALKLSELKELHRTAGNMIKQREEGSEEEPDEPDYLDLKTLVNKLEPGKFDRSMLENVQVNAKTKVELMEELRTTGLKESDQLFQKIYADETFKDLPLR